MCFGRLQCVAIKIGAMALIKKIETTLKFKSTTEITGRENGIHLQPFLAT